jgi:hypothetical protein
MDQISEWIHNAGGNSVMLAVAGFEDYDFETVTKKMLSSAVPFIDNDGDGEDDDKSILYHKSFVVDTTDWYRGPEDPLRKQHDWDEKGVLSILVAKQILLSNILRSVFIKANRCSVSLLTI